MIHHVFANRSNAGDWLSARGIQSLLAPLPVTEHLCDAPFIADTLERLSGVTPDDLVVIGGGGLLMDYFVPFWEGLLELGDRVRFCLWGVGVCDMKLERTVPADALLSRIGSASVATLVRDAPTRALLGGDALPQPALCPTVVAVREPDTNGHGVLHVDSYDNIGAACFEAMDAFSRDFALRTGRPFARTNNILENGRSDRLAEILHKYAAADVVVTSRLHGCITAIAMNRRVIALSGDWKVEWMMGAAGLGDWVLGLDQVERLPERLAAIDTQPSPRETVDSARLVHREFADRVRRLAS